MNYNKKITETQVRLGLVRFSYCNVFSPRVGDDSKPGKYSVCVLIPKSDAATVKTVEDAIAAAKQVGKTNKWNGKIPATCKSPLRDGDDERPEDEAFADCYFLNCNSNNRPGVRILEDGQLLDALDNEDFYSGCYGAVTVNFFPYENSGNKGIGCGLNNVVKLEDGDKLSGGRTADEDFGDLVGE